MEQYPGKQTVTDASQHNLKTAVYKWFRGAGDSGMNLFFLESQNNRCQAANQQYCKDVRKVLIKIENLFTLGNRILFKRDAGYIFHALSAGSG